MTEEKEMTVHGPSVGADVEQSNQLKSNYSINEEDPECNSFCDIRRGRYRSFAGCAEGAFAKGLPLPSGGRKPAQRAASFDGEAVKSAFALLSQKVTKARCCRSGWKGCDLI